MRASYFYRGRCLGAEIVLTPDGLEPAGPGWRLGWMRRVIARKPEGMAAAEYLLRLAERHAGDLIVRIVWDEDCP